MAGKKWMIYGANGYTGKLTARLAAKRELQPILAGRNQAEVERIANEYGMETRIFDLSDSKALSDALSDISLILHMAGPFSTTSKPMVDACLKTKTHYLDITGEIPVLDSVLKRDAEAKAAGVTLIPGVGFDVVPTDCLASMLSERMPDATHLELAFGGEGKFSPGTTKTMIEGMSMGAGGAARIDGKITEVPAAWKTRNIPFPKAKPFAISIPWGDVASAWYSTGIPNIITYAGMPPAAEKSIKRATAFAPLLKIDLIKKAANKLIEWTIHGPSDDERTGFFSEVWGEVRNETGKSIQGTLTSPEGYILTADSSLRAVLRVLDGTAAGALTPSKAFGSDFIRECDGVTVHEFTHTTT